MSSTLGDYGATDRVPRPWFAALFTSSTIYVGLAVALAVLGVGTKQIVAERPVDVTFVEKVVKEEPPPPPPPPPPEPTPEPPKPQPPPPAAAPVIPPDMKVRILDKPPPPKELVAPVEMPQAVPEEADPSEDKGIAVYGEPGQGDPAGLEGGSVEGVVGGQVGAPIELPEGASPPVPNRRNSPPPYPMSARRSGRTGSVVLKIVITADGEVDAVKVVEGEEPFVTAAVDTVKGWRYSPARFKGQPITVYRTIRVGFRLND